MGLVVLGKGGAKPTCEGEGARGRPLSVPVSRRAGGGGVLELLTILRKEEMATEGARRTSVRG
jgi:hypothetical protein